jgi:hypothetical protein
VNTQIQNFFGMIGCDDGEESMVRTSRVLVRAESDRSLNKGGLKGGHMGRVLARAASDRSLNKGGLKQEGRMGRAGRRLSTRAMRVKDVFKKKHVSFSLGANETKLVEQVEELEEEVRVATWWTEGEIDDIKAEGEKLAWALDAGNTAVDGRGLEAKTEEGNWIAYKARLDATNVVLDEQDRQRQQQFLRNDDEGFRKVYLEVSETCVEEAVKRGKEDEEAVQDYLQDTRAQEASVMISDHGPRYSGRQRQRLQ